MGGLAREAALVGHHAAAQPLHRRLQPAQPLLGRVPPQPHQEDVGHPVTMKDGEGTVDIRYTVEVIGIYIYYFVRHAHTG